jgi:halimadienyl-diphosphate synthase
VSTGQLPVPTRSQPPLRPRCSCQASATGLLDGMLTRPWGQVSPSVYETGRLVTLAPWLSGHEARVDFLLAAARPDGSWGGPGGYGLVPTLSATEALLSTTTGDGAPNRPGVLAAIDRALSNLFDSDWAAGRWTDLPDTPAIEIIVPALVELLNQHLDRLAALPLAGLGRWSGSARLPLASEVDAELLRTIRSVVAAGLEVPAKLLHCLEVTGTAADNAPGVRPLPVGMIGASPAATAAWLGNPCRVGREHPAVRYLKTVVRLHGGPVPSVIPMTAFEHSWVLGGLASAGLASAVPDALLDALAAGLGPDGTPGGPGLPPDADTTSGALHALWAAGIAGDLDCLRRYEVDTHFCTWAGERTPSATTNAHVLDALTDARDTSGDGWPRSAAAKTAGWLCEQQRPDGSWLDKWHASPYYATACCATALGRLGDAGPGRAVGRAVGRSVDWVLASQRADGSWGHWGPSPEETAYAIQTLLLTGPGPDPDAVDRAVARGYRWLGDNDDELTNCPPLWHDKDLYLPGTIVRAVVLSARHLAHAAPGVMRQVNR